MTAAPATAADVGAMLRRHYLPEGRPAGGILAEEIMSPDGRRRADALWVTTTTVGRGTLIGHEVKVTRSDVLAELADPTKADAWARYCDRWYLTVSDPAMVEGLDIPEQWGIMAPPSGRRTRSMTVLRAAPQLHPIDKAEAMTRLLIWHQYRAAARESELQGTVRWREDQIVAHEQVIADLRASGASSSTSIYERHLREILLGVERALREHPDWRLRSWDDITVEEISAAVIDARAVRRAARDQGMAIRAAQKRLSGLTEPLGRVNDLLALVLDETPDDSAVTP